jgi:urease gamma subunit
MLKRNKGIWINLFEMIKNGMVPALNVDDQTEKYDGKCKTEMMFVSANNKNMKIIDKLANDCYKNTKFNTNVITLCGDIRINGKKIKQENAEKVVAQFVEESYAENKHVMIISNIIGQRSFSEKEITNLFLCYDNGQKGATQQKMARALTSGQEEKIANIISLSFDPNRDDKFIEMFMETAKSKMKKNPNIKSLNQAMNEIIPVVSMYVFGEDGNRVAINKSEYMRKIIADNGITKICARTAELSVLTDEQKLEISTGKKYQQDKTEKVEKGKAKDSKPRESNSTISTRNQKNIDLLCRRVYFKRL